MQLALQSRYGSRTSVDIEPDGDEFQVVVNLDGFNLVFYDDNGWVNFLKYIEENHKRSMSF